jgi:hypothetical protein
MFRQSYHKAGNPQRKADKNMLLQDKLLEINQKSSIK